MTPADPLFLLSILLLRAVLWQSPRTGYELDPHVLWAQKAAAADYRCKVSLDQSQPLPVFFDARSFLFSLRFFFPFSPAGGSSFWTAPEGFFKGFGSFILVKGVVEVLLYLIFRTLGFLPPSLSLSLRSIASPGLHRLSFLLAFGNGKPP